MTSSKSKSEKITFKIEEGPFRGKYAFKYPKVNVPELGIVAAGQLITMPEVISHLLEINSGAIEKI